MPLNDSVSDTVKDYLYNERMPDDRVVEGNEDALFLSLQGKRMTERQIRELVKKYTAIAMKTGRAGGYSPHKLRATAATSLIGRGNSIYDVAALLDHEQVTTTQLYARQKQGVKRDLVKDMEWEKERLEGLNASNAASNTVDRVDSAVSNSVSSGANHDANKDITSTVNNNNNNNNDSAE